MLESAALALTKIPPSFPVTFHLSHWPLDAMSVFTTNNVMVRRFKLYQDHYIKIDTQIEDPIRSFNNIYYIKTIVHSCKNGQNG